MYATALWNLRKLIFQCIKTRIDVYYCGLSKDLHCDIGIFRTDLVSNNFTNSCLDVGC